MPIPNDRSRAVSPGPVYMNEAQMGSFLQDLRSNRPTRPVGSRPPPSTWSSRSAYERKPLSESPTTSPLTQSSFKDAAVEPEVKTPPTPAPEPISHPRTTSDKSIDGVIMAGTPGRALVQPPRGRDMATSATARDRTPSIQYRESGRRQVEREEARELRLAMEELDMDPEERLFKAARDEAADLVWKHQNPNAPESNTDGAYAYPGLAKKGEQLRSRSVGRGEEDLQRSQSKLKKRNSMGSSTGGSRSSSVQSHRTPSGSSSVTAIAGFSTSPTKDTFSRSLSPDKSATLPRTSSNPSGIGQRRRSSGTKRKVSLFKDPNDKIYEEPEEEAVASTPTTAPAPTPAPAVAEPPPPAKVPLQMRRNPFSRVQFAKNNSVARSNTDPIAGMKNKLNRVEIHRNPPTQTRTAPYTSNSGLPVKPNADESALSDIENEPEVKMKDGKEIRSDDIRAATGFKLKDRSPRLPTPTVVSDKPGRPIVSFRKDWFKPKEVELKEEISSAPPRPLSQAQTAPAIPTISLPEEPPKNTRTPSPAPIPSISVSDDYRSPSPSTNRSPIPTINVHEKDLPARPLPTPISRKVNTSHSTTSPIPTINVSQTPPPPARSQSTATPPIPTICVQETPKISIGADERGGRVKTPSIPTFSFDEPRDSTPRGRVTPPSISVTPSVPSINVNKPLPAPSISVTPSVPSINVSGPATSTRPLPTPSISVSPSVPHINVNGPGFSTRPLPTPSISVSPSVPSINVNGPATSTRPLPTPSKSSPAGGFASQRRLPDPTDRGSRPFPRNSTRSNTSHWTPTSVRTGALCTQCALPISGRIVSAAGSRFHPECFKCHHCSENLEAVAFYPEPDNKYLERVSRIRARQAGLDVPFPSAHATEEDMMRLEQEDGFDESQRFFCHLDFHELFSPRCKSCKTPIEGEVVVACGAEWHVGHFFCAQCGDPFDSSTPFVEKEGYAWCVGCHTNRFSTKCRKCRKPVTDTVVKALGAEWHMQCFCCTECGGEFVDGRYFLRADGRDPVCVACEERRLKA